MNFRVKFRVNVRIGGKNNPHSKHVPRSYARIVPEGKILSNPVITPTAQAAWGKKSKQSKRVLTFRKKPKHSKQVQTFQESLNKTPFYGSPSEPSGNLENARGEKKHLSLKRGGDGNYLYVFSGVMN